MTALREAAEHQLFLVEQHGDTVVVTPRGDAVGFTAYSVNAEQSVVTEILKRESVKHLVVDLSGSNYFGSIVLGALIHMGQLVRGRRGRIALAGASSDMEDVLRLMRLDSLWELFHDRRAALRAIAAIPFRERLWALRRSAMALLVIAAVALAIVYFPRPDYGKRYYIEIAQLWREALAKRPTAGDEEWERYLKRTEAKLEPIIRHMDRRSRSGIFSETELYLTYAARDHWRPALGRSSPDAETHARMVQYFLDCAAATIEHRVPPPMPRDVQDVKEPRTE
jgi:anti-sigma B factor antagonist/stage II sporulation protein AA (anti-sigma F factor antagonist)